MARNSYDIGNFGPELASALVSPPSAAKVREGRGRQRVSGLLRCLYIRSRLSGVMIHSDNA